MLIKDNKHIPAEDKDFFTVLRIGLWQKVEEPLSNNPDWSYIYNLACEQTVQGIVADGIGLIKAAYDRGDFGNTPFPSGEGWGEAFLEQSAQIIRQNYKVNQVQVKVCQLLSDSGIKHFVVKGQEVAKNYSHPMLRCSGDIDLVIRMKDFDKAVSLLTLMASMVHPYETEKQDQSFDIDGITIELHGNLHPSLGSRINTILDQLQDELFACAVSYETFSLIYIFLHCLQHYHWTGLGIRQITDFCTLYANSRDKIDFNSVSEVVRQMNLQNEWSVFTSFIADYLGYSPDTMPTVNSRQPTASLWQAAKNSGNFGHNHTKVRHPNFLVRNLLGIFHCFTETLRTRHVSPSLGTTILSLRLKNYIKQLTR